MQRMHRCALTKQRRARRTHAENCTGSAIPCVLSCRVAARLPRRRCGPLAPPRRLACHLARQAAAPPSRAARALRTARAAHHPCAGSRAAACASAGAAAAARHPGRANAARVPPAGRNERSACASPNPDPFAPRPGRCCVLRRPPAAARRQTASHGGHGGASDGQSAAHYDAADCARPCADAPRCLRLPALALFCAARGAWRSLCVARALTRPPVARRTSSFGFCRASSGA